MLCRFNMRMSRGEIGVVLLCIVGGCMLGIIGRILYGNGLVLVSLCIISN